MHNLSSQIRPLVAMDAAAAGTDDELFSDVIDMDGAEGICFFVLLGTVTADAELTLEVLGGDTSGTCVNLLDGSAEVDASETNTDKVLFLDVFKPTYRYVRFRLTRATANAVISAGMAARYAARRNHASLPVVANSEVAGGEFLASPDDTGTDDSP